MAGRTTDRRRAQLRMAKRAQRERERSRGLVHLQLALPRALASKLRLAHQAAHFASALESFLDDFGAAAVGPNAPQGAAAAGAQADIVRQIDRLIDDCRSTCLWYRRPASYPRTRADQLRVLDAIQRHADRDTFIRAGKLKRCLSQNSNDGSAAS